jgi:hypothetical protein
MKERPSELGEARSNRLIAGDAEFGGVMARIPGPIRSILILIAILIILTPSSGMTQNPFDEFLENFRRTGAAVLYSECQEIDRKILLLITLTQKETYNIWVFPVSGDWLLGGAHVVIKNDGFEFIDPPGGHGTREKVRWYVDQLLKSPLKFLFPNQMETLRFSVPEKKCFFEEGEKTDLQQPGTKPDKKVEK